MTGILNKIEKVSFPVLIVILVLVGLSVFYIFVKDQGPPTWDGAEHSFHGLRVHTAIQNSDWNMFKQATVQQTLWPFLHSWIIAGMGMIFEPDFMSIRLLSILLWLATSVLTYFIGKRLAAESIKKTTGLFAAILVLSSPMYTLYASQPMLEMPGAFLTMCIIWLMTREDKKMLSTACIVGILLLATFFLKYVYALLLAVSLGLFVIVDFVADWRQTNSGKRKIGVHILRTAFLFIPILIGAAYWLSTSGVLKGFMAFQLNPETGLSLFSPLNWILYPVVLILYYFPSPIIALIVIGFAFTRGNVERVRPKRFILLYILTSLFLLTIYHYKLTRAIFTVLPALAILGSSGLMKQLAFGSKSGVKKIAVMISAGLVCIHIPLIFFPSIPVRLNPALKGEFEHMMNFDKELHPALKKVAAQLKDEQNFAVVGHSHDINPAQIAWYVYKAKGDFPQYLPSLLRWDKPFDNPNLELILKARKLRACLVINIIPNTFYDKEDFRNNYAWMSRSLVMPKPGSDLQLIWETRSENGLKFEFWKFR